jgi:outer membrane lipoprotein-sorting protein
MLPGRSLRAGACVVVLSLMAWSSALARAADQAAAPAAAPAVAPAAAPAAAPAGKDAVVAALQALQKDVKSYTASGKSTFGMGDRSFEQTLALIAKAPGKYKETSTSDRGGTQTERVTLCDGKTVWLPARRDGPIRTIDRAAVAAALGIKDEDMKNLYLPGEPIDLANPLIALKADTIKYDGKQKMGDADVYVFEGEAKWPMRQGRGGESSFRPKQKLMIDATDGLLRSVTTYSQEGDAMRVVTYTDVKVNPAVEDSVFEFKLPEGGTVQDDTGATIAQMQPPVPAPTNPVPRETRQ